MRADPRRAGWSSGALAGPIGPDGVDVAAARDGDPRRVRRPRQRPRRRPLGRRQLRLAVCRRDRSRRRPSRARTQSWFRRATRPVPFRQQDASARRRSRQCGRRRAAHAPPCARTRAAYRPRTSWGAADAPPASCWSRVPSRVDCPEVAMVDPCESRSVARPRGREVAAARAVRDNGEPVAAHGEPAHGELDRTRHPRKALQATASEPVDGGSPDLSGRTAARVTTPVEEDGVAVRRHRQRVLSLETSSGLCSYSSPMSATSRVRGARGAAVARSMRSSVLPNPARPCQRTRPSLASAIAPIVAPTSVQLLPRRDPT